MQCRIVTSGQPPSSSTPSASVISSRLLMPVESRTGVFSAAIASRYGRFVISPEGILSSGSPSVPRNRTLGRSNGAERYWMPMESQYSFSSRWASNEKCSRRIISSWLSAASVVCFWYSAFWANLLTTSSGTAVWYFTISAPHALATRAISLAISRLPLWFTPASAMMVIGMVKNLRFFKIKDNR